MKIVVELRGLDVQKLRVEHSSRIFIIFAGERTQEIVGPWMAFAKRILGLAKDAKGRGDILDWRVCCFCQLVGFGTLWIVIFLTIDFWQGT